MNSRTLDDMNKTIRKALHEHKIPWQPHVIAGVHKSGLLAATMFGAHLNVPVVPLRQLWEANWIHSGLRTGIKEADQDNFLAKSRRVLIVEDAAGTGKTFGQFVPKLPAKHKYFKVCVFGTKKQVPNFDLVLDHCPGPRIFEWNWRDSVLLQGAVMDIDGVFCPDPPTPEERDNHKQYIHHIQTARPLYVPRKPVMALATSRLERFRPQTEQWLRDNKIQYKHLYMAPFKTPAERRIYKNFRVKADVYANRKDAVLFVESHDKTARWIQQATKRPVFSVESGTLV